jgi:hypothetical protein
MSRSINEIKESMLEAYANDEIIQKKYNVGSDGKLVFSKVSVENILFYVIATMFWTIEKLFDRHRQEVVDYIDNMKPHSLRWYVSKAKMFRIGMPLIVGTDRYSDIDDEGNQLTEVQIEGRQLVKFAAATEFVNTTNFSNQGTQPVWALSNSDGVVYLKVAKGDDTNKSPLSRSELEAFTRYINEVKDAGVMVRIINERANPLRLELDVYVNPMVIRASDGKTLDGSGEPVIDAIKHYISNLPFNGEYRNVDLVDVLQKVEGVVIPELKKAEDSYGGLIFSVIDAKSTPASGHYYFDAEGSTIRYEAYNQ